MSTINFMKKVCSKENAIVIHNQEYFSAKRCISKLQSYSGPGGGWGWGVNSRMCVSKIIAMVSLIMSVKFARSLNLG